jgi:hypothetical protein
MQHYNANRDLIMPEEGMLFTLLNGAAGTPERYSVSSIITNRAHVPVGFTALGSGGRPQQFPSPTSTSGHRQGEQGSIPSRGNPGVQVLN